MILKQELVVSFDSRTGVGKLFFLRVGLKRLSYAVGR